MEFKLAYATEDHVNQLSKERGEPAWLTKDRLKALKAFDAIPAEPNPLFVRHTDLRGVDPSKLDAPGNVGVPVKPVYDGGDKAAMASISEGRIEEARILGKLKERDFYFNEASQLVKEKPKLAKTLLTRAGGLPKDDKFGVMSRALFSTAFVIYVPPRVEITLPLHLRWTFSEQSTSLLTRTVIYLAKGSRASVLEEFDSEKTLEGQSLFGNATEVVLEEGATLKYAAIERFGDHVASFLTRQAILGANGALSQALGSFGGLVCKSRADTLLKGTGSEVRQVEVIYGNGKEKYDNGSFVIHQGQNTVSDLISKAVMQESSKSAIKGIITIQESALNSDTYVGQYAMILSKKAKSTAIPSLEINTNEVQRAKHAASVAQVDDDQLFYLMSRGVPRDHARRMLVEGFLNPLVEQVELPQARERLSELIDTKWVG